MSVSEQQEKQTIRLVVADDHTMVRQGIVQMLRQHARMQVVAECEDGSTMLQAALRLVPDVILMDISMPKMNGLVAIEKLLGQRPNAKVLVLTMHEEVEYMHAMHRAGAKGYVLKEASSEQLITAIETIAAGNVFFPAVLMQEIADGTPVIGPHESVLSLLTPREREVFHLVVTGMVTREVADLLNMSVKTAEHHRGKMLQKLKVANTAELIRLAARKGILD